MDSCAGKGTAALAKFKPDVIVLNAGDTRLAGYAGSIIMGKDDMLHASQAAPEATIVASHMDAINHMTLSCKELQEHAKQPGIQHPYDVTQQWAAAVHEHPANVDGFLFVSKQLNDQRAAVLFDRAQKQFGVPTYAPLAKTRGLAQASNRLGIVIVS